MQRKEEDRLFSLLVRTRAGWRCEYDNCSNVGKCYKQDAHGLHASHIISRKYNGGRWHYLNCWAHCQSCHSYLGDHPHIFGEWVRRHLGERYGEFMELTRRIKGVPVKFTKVDKKELRKQMREELKRMQGTPQTDFHLEIVDEVLSR